MITYFAIQIYAIQMRVSTHRPDSFLILNNVTCLYERIEMVTRYANICLRLIDFSVTNTLTGLLSSTLTIVLLLLRAQKTCSLHLNYMAVPYDQKFQHTTCVTLPCVHKKDELLQFSMSPLINNELLCNNSRQCSRWYFMRKGLLLSSLSIGIRIIRSQYSLSSQNGLIHCCRQKQDLCGPFILVTVCC